MSANNSTLKCLHGTYIVLINRSAGNVYGFARLVLDFKRLSKADSIRIEIHKLATVLILIKISIVENYCEKFKNYAILLKTI